MREPDEKIERNRSLSPHAKLRIINKKVEARKKLEAAELPQEDVDLEI